MQSGPISSTPGNGGVPEGCETLELTVDARVGGQYVWRLRTPDGFEMKAFGEYREVRPRERLVYTWVWADDPEWENHESIVTVEFIARDAHTTELKLTHENLPSRDSRDNHIGGWTSALDRFTPPGGNMTPERNIVVSHHFAHPAELVGNAWLDPVQARQFLFATDGGEIIRCEIDARVGGSYTITERRGADEVEHVGKYLKIERPKKLPQRIAFTLKVPKYSPGGGDDLRAHFTPSRRLRAFPDAGIRQAQRRGTGAHRPRLEKHLR